MENCTRHGVLAYIIDASKFAAGGVILVELRHSSATLSSSISTMELDFCPLVLLCHHS